MKRGRNSYKRAGSRVVGLLVVPMTESLTNNMIFNRVIYQTRSRLVNLRNSPNQFKFKAKA